MSTPRRLIAVTYFAFLAFGLAITPRLLGDVYRKVPQAELTRSRLGERLVAIQDRYRQFATEAKDLRYRVEKIRIAYGLIDELGAPPELIVAAGAFLKSVYQEEIGETAQLASRARLEIVDLEVGVKELRAFEERSSDFVSFTPSLSPVTGDFVLTAPMGSRKSPFSGVQEYHTGVDLSAPVGTKIRAPADGRVVFTGRFRVRQRSAWWRFGKMVAVSHGERFLTLYGHLDEIDVRRGTTVARGDELGTVGESGVTANPHVHYSVWRLDDLGAFEPVDPRIFMMDRRWSDEEEFLRAAAESPQSWQYEGLPRTLR